MKTGRGRVSLKPGELDGAPPGGVEHRAKAGGGVSFTPPARRDRISNVGNGSVHPFIGRETVLRELRSAVRGEHVVVLESEEPGLPGIGGSTIARHYALAFAREYSVVWLMRCARGSVWAAQYVELADALALPQVVARDQEEMIAGVRGWLSSNGNWLLVLDDFALPDMLERFIPPNPKGHVIILSAAHAELDSCPRVTVPSLSGDAVEALFRQLSGAKDDGEVPLLASVLEGLPLAVALAGGYSGQTRTSSRQLKETIETRLAGLADAASPECVRGTPVDLLSALTVARLSREHPEAAALLTFCSFLGPCPIPFTLIRDAAGMMPAGLARTVHDDEALARACTVLDRWRVGDASEGTVCIHGAVQEAVRGTLTKEARKNWARTALRAIAALFPIESRYDHVMPACARMLEHVFAVTERAEELELDAEETGFLLNQAGQYLEGCGETQEAAHCFRKAVDMAHVRYGDYHDTTASRVNNLGVALQRLGHLGQARDCFERTRKICTALHGPVHETLLMPTVNLARVSEQMKDTKAAKNHYGRAIELCGKVHGWYHPITAECAHALGGIWLERGRNDMARKCYESALLAEESSESSSPVRRATYHSSLASLLLRTRNAKEAADHYRTALELDRSVGLQRALKRDLTGLGKALRARGAYAESVACLREALRLTEGHEGPDSAKAARLLGHLGKALQRMGKADEAAACFERALRIDEKLAGGDSPDGSRVWTNLGKAREAQGLLAEALDCFRKALACEESASPQRIEDITAAQIRVGRTLEAMDRLDEALDTYKQALALDKRHSGEQHPDTARDTYRIGCLLKKQGDTIAALIHLKRAAETYEATLGRDHPSTWEAQTALEQLGN